jgi:hypothetical protein
MARIELPANAVELNLIGLKLRKQTKIPQRHREDVIDESRLLKEFAPPPSILPPFNINPSPTLRFDSSRGALDSSPATSLEGLGKT